MRLRPQGLRTRLTASAVFGSALTLATLVTTFNLLLDSRLRADGEKLLRESTAAVIRSLSTADGHLQVPESPDQSAIDSQTWIFAGARVAEQPAAADPRNERAAMRLAQTAGGFTTVDVTDTRMEAVAIRQGSRRLGTVVAAMSLGPYESTARLALVGSVLLGLFVLAAVAALSRWLIHRALVPVARMTSAAADWREHELSRRFFLGEPHDELTTLASVLDGLLQRLAHGLRREEQLTAEVSHELRTPLAKILAEAELASSRQRSPQEYQAALDQIRCNAQDLQRVLETLLASARSGTQGRATTSDARESAERVARPMQETLTTQGKSIEVIAPQSAKVAIDASVVERILSPLLENAARFATRRIVIDIATEGATVVFEIGDDGPGIAVADRERIFEPGYSGAAQPPSSHLSAGLGLPLARRLAHAAGGDIEARACDHGGRLVVRLPAG